MTTNTRRWLSAVLQGVVQSMAGWLAGLALAAAAGPALASPSPFVSYDFSSHDGGLPFSGNVTFSSGMPVTDTCCNWVEYQPSAVVTVTSGSESWSNAATPGGYCDVWFHVGWIQVTFWCKLQEPSALLGENFFRLDFLAAYGSNFDPEPIGPYTPDNFHDQKVSGQLWTQTGDPLDFWNLRNVSLDAVRITPYVSEPGVPALLAIGALAGLVGRRRRHPRTG